MQTGVLIGTGNAFLRQRFRFARQLQVQHCLRDYWKFVPEVTRASRAVTFVARDGNVKECAETAGFTLM